jgi:Luciferase-like monooxygenase
MSPAPRASLDLYASPGLWLDEAVAVATAAESAGFGGLWTLEAHTEPFLPLALAAEHTSRIELPIRPTSSTATRAAGSTSASAPRSAPTSPGGSGHRSTIPPSG